MRFAVMFDPRIWAGPAQLTELRINRALYFACNDRKVVSSVW
jgi:hypothetical protein